MARRYSEPVEVRATRVDREDAGGDPGGAAGGMTPASFLWRGRLYVVRDVLGHWRERRAWWTTPAARAVHGEGEGGTGGGDPAAADLAGSSLGEEHEVWRVEASAGRGFGTGVYDLWHDVAIATMPSTPDTDPGRRGGGGPWRMHQVTD